MPEVVPFRLTQTLVEALGLAGGTAAAYAGFRRASPACPTMHDTSAAVARPTRPPITSRHALFPLPLPAAGPKGRFRAGCERTLHALRANAAPLAALLEAALLDAAVDWDAEAAAKAASKVGSAGCAEAG